MLTWKAPAQHKSLSVIKMNIREVTMLIVAHGKMWNGCRTHLRNLSPEALT